MRRPWLPAVFVVVLSGCSVEAASTPLPVRQADPAFVAPVTTTRLATGARLSALPMAGKAGDKVKLTGQGFPPNARVVLSFHDTKVGEVTADAVGGFADAEVVVPDSFGGSGPGTQFFLRAGAGPYQAEAPFVLTG
ncbi:hypothetical protein GCM10022243_50490 [Saccharothrix violaceirubra]|uniref:IPT/TIG domain-containing protein n=1 Tax=Saccharothrix violaceirubra TaxID=413306 RepID=A0A7W7SZ37_9PSEU|nr:hypothetical protein [Saccharothrix violaceirubra]MBB4963609.1 hypothetical protein [Saccharothrix violaceirubra]